MTNLSKQKREVLEGKIELLRSKLDATDVEAQSALFALEAELKHKKYGLVWEEHEEEIDRTLSENLPVLTEQTELAVNAGGLTHFLLEGDNLAALEILKRTHKGKIDVIYIDPPYNTGSDFLYDDKLVDKNDTFRHSKWVSWMQKRLLTMKQLLSENWVFVASIDDNEFAPFRILCDEVFGEDNFIGNIDWESKTKSQNTKTAYRKLQPKVEHLLCYGAQGTKHKFNLYKVGEKNYDKEDDRGEYREHEIELMNAGGIRGRKSMVFEISDGSATVFPPEGKQWKIGQDMIIFYKDNGDLFIRNNKAYIKMRPEYERSDKFEPFWAFYDKEIGTAESAKKELNKIVPNHGFETVKPTELIKSIVFHCTKNGTVLDFFAGSGTTGQAVLELNEEDGGSRQFILCTNNENNICRNITYERMKTVITGKRQDGSAYSDGIAATLKYDKIDYVAVKEDGDILLYDDYADELLRHVREMVELENGISFETDSTIKICLYEDELDEFVDALDEKSEVRAVYVEHDLLMTAQQKAKLAALNVAVNIIPQYYYEDEV